MKRKILTGFLALVLVLQAFIPSFAYALEEKPKDNKLITKKLESSDSNFITIGKLKGVGFSKDNPTASISVEEVEQKNNHKKEALGGLEIGDEIVPQALRSTKSPYIQGQQPADSEKPKYWANVQGTLTTVGLDGGSFDWNKVLGQGAKVKLLFTQTSGNVMTGVRFYLEVDKDGTYTWKGSDGKPTYLPLYDVDGNPYTYNVQIQRNFSENVQLIIQESNGTPGVSWRPEGDKQVATISFLNIEIQQVASTKFVSEWHTSLAEGDRPQIEGYFEADTDVDNNFNFPKNNTTRTILRSSFLENFVEGDEENGPWSFLSSELEKTPKKVEVKTDTQGLTFEEKGGVKTVKSGDHKFKYGFSYDVINGGKLTMTEVIPVTFDANGGKFASILDENAEQKIVKEVDYEGTLIDKAENPTREGKTFKGWSTTVDGKTPATDADFENITEKKTFYAIWENNDIKAKELTVAESFKDGTGYVNDFIPTLDTLKGQVEIKDANGVYQKLKDGDSLQILDDSGNAIADADLKDNLYDKLKEDPATEVSRNLTLKAKVNFADGTSQGIEIPIKVIKNIYEGTSTGGKPSYVPKNYVKVTVDPTDKATNSQKTYYYVNPAAKVVIPGSNPEGKDNNVFTKWTMKADTATGDGTEYKLVDKPRTQFKEASTITAQYDKEGKGIIKIAYVDENGNEISADYHKDGVDYPSKKEGKLNSEARDEEFPKPGPDFKGYIYSSRDDIKGKYYKDQSDPDNLDTVKYSYFKKVTTEEPTNKYVYFPVIFDANDGKFESDPKDKKTVYVYFNGNDATVEKVTFKEVKDEFEKAYSNPTKDGFDFKEWQNAKTDGKKPADEYEIKFKGWDWDADPDNGYVPETFYAHYGKASALISYLDLDGHKIDDKFKISTVEYPTEKEGTLDEAIKSDVFTAETAPKFIGYKFNRIELNPKDGKYALDNKATIKIYYEKLDDIIPDPTPDTDDDKPAGYVTVKFLADDATHTGEDVRGKLEGTRKFYVNPKADPVKTMAEITQPTITAKQGFKVADPKWKDAEGNALATATEITKDLTYTAQYTGLDDIIKDPTPEDNTDKPEGYVTVTFKPGDHGKLDNDTKDVVYYVNPKANPLKTMNDIAEPTVTANTNYEVDTPNWKDAEDNALVTATKITKDLTYTAQYKFTKDVVPQGPGEGKPVVPDNYLKVTFKEGDHGIISASQTTIYWVNPDKEVTLTAPAVTANADYKHTAWKYNVNSQDKTTSGTDATKTVKDTFANETTITAKYLKKVLTEDPNDTENYVKVTFVAGDNGTIANTETTTYWVLRSTDVKVTPPKVTPNSGYTFTEWNPAVKTNYDADTTHTAQYNEKDKVLTEDPKDTDYIKVTFNANGGKIGMEDAKDVWVLKDIATFADAKAKIATPIKEKATFKEWQDKASEGTAVEGTKVLSTANETFYAAYTDYDKIIEDPTTNTPEDGYVRLTFDATDAGRIGTADGEQKKVIDVLKGTPYTDKDLKDKLDEIKAVPVKADGGSTVKDTEKAFDKWTPAVPTTGYVKTETFTASYKKFIPKQEKIDITATKAWQDVEGNTPNFTTPEVKFELWRKAGQAGTEEIVKEATALENNSVTFSKVDKYDANGVEYIYFVKEVFTNPAEKENWTVSGEGTLNLTNKLKGDSTDPGTDKVGKLTITKKLENEPVALKAFSMMRAPAPAASEQLKFKFKVTGPYGYEETFELAANESKTLDKLAYGDYKVEETDTKGYKAEYSKTKETLTKENPNGSITVTNKNKIPGENETNDNIIDVTVTKVWVGGEKPATEIQLWRTGYGLNGKVFQEKVDSFTTAAKGDDTQTHKFEKLAKQDPSGKEFTYYAVEENVPANYTASYSEDNLTVTNTYNAPAKKYTVIYKAGSSTATGTMAADTDARGTYTVKAIGFTNDGYTFKGWKVGDTTQIVQPGDTINVTGDVTLTAQWEKTTTPPTPDPDNPNPDKPNPWDPDPKPWNPDYPKPWNPNYPDLPYIPRYPEIRYETIVQEKIVKVPVPIADNAYVKEVRYMQGFMGDFRPKDGLTRAEAAQILANALVEDGYKYNPNFKLPYKDIGEAWYTRAVKIVTEARVFAGYDDGNFKPQDKITRNEWIATLKRFQELGDVSGNHMKLKDGHWAMAEIEAAYKEGWLKIYSDGLATYEGDKFIPREEVAAVSNKAFNRVLDKTYIINNDKNLITYKDVKKDMWSYEDVLCASNTFLYKKDLYRAHWIKEDNNQFNINTDGFEIVKAKFQRNPR